MLRQQLILVQRKRKRALNLTTSNRFLFGLLSFLIAPNRLQKIAIIVKPTTLLKLHKALVNRKYHLLYSNKRPKKPGRKPPSQTLIDLVLELKQRIPNYGYRRIAIQIFQSFGIKVSCFSVGRIIRKYNKSHPGDNGPSWLTFIGHMKDSLWFEFHHWQANLRIIDVDEIKSVPGNPTSHPFIERVIGTCRREVLDHTLFWNERDLLDKLNEFKKYYNETRGHWSLDSATPEQKTNFKNTTHNIANLENYRWKKHCRGLFQTPIAA